MSATGRNLVGHERRPADFYATPSWVTRLILPHLGTPRSVLEPAAGEGAIMREARAFWPKANVVGTELDPERAASSGSLCADALTTEPRGYDLIITNPPFSLAEEFVRWAIAAQEGVGTSAFLLRLAFLESQGRAKLHRQFPSDVFVLPRRPSFTNGGTDMAAYAWFVWGPGRGGRWQILGDA